MSEEFVAEPTVASAELGEAAAGAAEPTAGAAAAANAGTTATAAAAPVVPKRTNLNQNILLMKLEQMRLKMERTKVMKELKNANKRKTRLKARAKMLTDNDLVEVIAMRAEMAAAAGDGSSTGGSTETVSPSGASASTA